MIYLHNDFKGIRSNLVYALLENNFFHPSNTIRFFEALYDYVNTSDLMIDSRNVDLIFCDLFNVKNNDFANVSSNKIQPNFDSFCKYKKRFKIIVSEIFSYYDPQIFLKDIPHDVMFDQKALALNVASDDLQKYLDTCAWSKDAFKGKLDQIYENLSKYNPNVIVLRMLYYQTYKQADLLNDPRFIFVPCDLLVEDIQVDISKDRNFDYIIAGVQKPEVYPYRYLFSQHLSNDNSLTNIIAWDEYVKHLLKKQDMEKTFLSNQASRGMFDEANYIDLNQNFLVEDTQYQTIYYKQIQECTFAIGCASVFGYPLKKYFEFMANGAVIVGQLPKFAEEYGIIPNVNIIECQPNKIVSTLNFLKKNENKDLVKSISKNARKLIESRYLPKVSVNTFFQDVVRQIQG
jgi:hypothetical protein